MKLIRQSKRAFTAIELLVVIAVSVVIVATLLPALANTKVQSQVFRCQNNLKQLTRAWAQYTTDNNDNLLNPTTWVGNSTMNWTSGSNNIDTAPLLTNSIGVYVKAPSLFKCPADKYQSIANPGPRARSVSMNGNVGSGTVLHLTGLSKTGPAKVIVILDEQADSIGDGNFSFAETSTPPSEQWKDLPACYHNAAGSFSFADGHTEIHKWQNPKLNPTIYPVTFSSFALWLSISGKSVDYEYMLDRMP